MSTSYLHYSAAEHTCEIGRLSAVEMAELREWFSARSIDGSLLAFYSENGSVARAMMEWRHRVITLYVLTLGGVGSSLLWLKQLNALRGLPLPFFIGAVIMCVLALMDNTNATILRACYRVGDGIEQGIAGAEGTIYAALFRRSQGKRTFTYTRILRVLYVGTALAFLGTALFFVRS